MTFPDPFDGERGEPIALVGPFFWQRPHYKVFRYIGKGRWVPQCEHVRIIGFSLLEDLP